MSKQFEIKDSGERRSFETGAKRDTDGDKPRFDLIPITVLPRLIDYYIKAGNVYLKSDRTHLTNEDKTLMWSLGLHWGMTVSDDLLLELMWMSLQAIKQQEGGLCLNVRKSMDGKDDLYFGFHLISPKTYLRLANHYGGGAKKYDSWNWSKGIPFSVFHASLMRHIFAIIMDKTDEDHLSAIFFNAASILHFRIINREDVDDVTPRLKEWGIL